MFDYPSLLRPKKKKLLFSGFGHPKSLVRGDGKSIQNPKYDGRDWSKSYSWRIRGRFTKSTFSRVPWTQSLGREYLVWAA